jgi:hypothetical protein
MLMAKLAFAIIGAGNFLAAIGAASYMLAVDDLTLLPSLLVGAGVAGGLMAGCAIESLDAPQLADQPLGDGADTDCRTMALVDQIHSMGDSHG